MKPEALNPGFLEQTASCLHHTYGDDLQYFCIVFPNVRAGLFFKKYLAQLSDKPVWAPSFRSLESLFEEIAGMTQADNLSLIFELFQAFKQHKQSEESFDDFYFWGEMLLDDFDELDKQLVDARALFCNMSDLKEIDRLFDYLTDEQKEIIRLFWKDFSETPMKTKFAEIWTLLHPVYESFKQRLKAKSLGYGGMIQREVVETERAAFLSDVYQKYVFIGFNALTKCESHFFKSLQKMKKALFFWDYDDYYLSNQWHEAGKFMRENLEKFPQEWKFDDKNLTNQSKNIEIISVPSETGQAKLAGQLLDSKIQKFKDSKTQKLLYRGIFEFWNDGIMESLGRTAIVLPDEHLLLPMLSSLPEAAREINITMGYPFTASPAYSLFERLASLQKHVRHYADSPRFNHNDVCLILYHPYVNDIVPEKANEIIKYIIEHNRIFIPANEISGHKLLQLIFRRCVQARDFSEYILSIISEIAAHSLKPQISDSKPQSSNLKPETEYLYTFYTTLQRIHDVLITNDVDMDVNVFCRLLRKHFISLKIPFSGEPLRGLQVMGMLETRALDFENVIILSMNEGIFPKGSTKQSFIPYSLRKGFDMTTSEQRDAISAYNFYRLIQRAKDVQLIYNSAATDSNTGEMSRYLSQLIYEPAFNVQQRNITFHVNIEHAKPIVKERDEKAQRILNMYLADTGDIKWLSPSAINSYIDCSLRFYFRYIEGLKEKDEVADEIDHSVFGKLLHKTMELIYAPYIEKELNVNTIVRLQKDKQGIQNALYKAFAKEYFNVEKLSDSDITGRNIIIREVLLKYIMRILEVDKNAAPFTILSLEKRIEMKLPVIKHEQTVLLNMSGYIDRLDRCQNTLRIIDYKTGNAQCNFTGIANLFDRSKTSNHAVFQTLTYARMMTLIPHPKAEKLRGELYVMKELFKENFDPRLSISKMPIDNYFDVANEFETELNRLLAEMLLSNAPFTQAENIKKCRNCAYKDICHR